MLLSRRGLDGGDDLAGDADFGKGMEGGELVRPEIAERLEQADHALLHDVLVIRADQKVGSRLGSDEVLVLVKQIFRCVRVSLLREQGDFLIGHAVKVVVHGFLPAHSSPRRIRSKISR